MSPRKVKKSEGRVRQIRNREVLAQRDIFAALTRFYHDRLLQEVRERFDTHEKILLERSNLKPPQE